MSKYLMLDHGGVLDDRIVHPQHVTKNDIVLGHIDGNARILKNGVQIVNTLNQLVSDYGYQIVYHSSNSARDQLNIHNELVQGALAKGLIFPPVIAAAAPDKALTVEFPENPNRRVLETTNITFLSYAKANSRDGKSCIRTALASYLGIPESKDERQKHVVFDDGISNIESARAEGYRAYLIGDKGVDLNIALNEILQQELRATGRDKKSYSILWPLAATGVSTVGFFSSNAVATAGTATSYGLFATAWAATPVWWAWLALLTVSTLWLARNIRKECKQDTNDYLSDQEKAGPSHSI